MYYGKSTPEMEKLRDEYESIFNFDPNGEIELEFSDYAEYYSLLETCVKEKRDMFDVLNIHDDEYD